MSNKKPNILVIAPHHDDEAIGCGGTIIKLVQKGCSVKVVHVFSGSSGVQGSTEDESRQVRTKEAETAAKLGGYEILPSLGFRDRDRSRDSYIQSSLIELLRREKPDIIFAPHDNETDYEHRLVSIATKEAVWLSATGILLELGEPLSKAPRTFYYEVWKNIENPSVINDIGAVIDMKRELLESFKSQMDTSGWVEGAVGRNAFRGVTFQGDGYCEVFAVENIRIEELVV